MAKRKLQRRQAATRQVGIGLVQDWVDWNNEHYPEGTRRSSLRGYGPYYLDGAARNRFDLYPSAGRCGPPGSA